MSDHAKLKTAYDLSREVYATEEKRFDDVETRIGRYLSVLFVILGASVFGIDDLRPLSIGPVANRVFLTFVVLFFASSASAFGLLLLALRVQRIRSLDLDHGVVDYFDRFGYGAALRGLAIGFLDAAAGVRAAAKRKIELARRGFGALIASAVFVAMGTGSYYFVDLPEAASMSRKTRESGGQGQDGGNVADQPAGSATGETPSASTDEAAAERAAAELFVDVEKSFEGRGRRD